jgi:hypothetical protein
MKCGKIRNLSEKGGSVYHDLATHLELLSYLNTHIWVL